MRIADWTWARHCAFLFVLASAAFTGDGIKNTDPDPRSFGRASAGVADTFTHSLSMFKNPASIGFIWDEDVELMPMLTGRDLAYIDPQNSTVRTGNTFLTSLNMAIAFDFEMTQDEVLEYHLPPELRDYSPPTGNGKPTQGGPDIPLRKVLNLFIKASVDKMPPLIEVQAKGKNFTVLDLFVVANYPGSKLQPDKGYTTTVAVDKRKLPVDAGDYRTLSIMKLQNLLPQEPNEIVLYYRIEVDFHSDADVARMRMLIGNQAYEGEPVTYEGVKPPPRVRAPQETLIPDSVKKVGKSTYSPLKFAFGLHHPTFVFTDFEIITNSLATSERFSNDLFIRNPSFGLAYVPSPRLSIGAAFDIRRMEWSMRTPLASGNFNEVEIKDATSYELSLRLGLLYKLSERFTFGLAMNLGGWQKEYSGHGTVTFPGNLQQQYRTVVTTGPSLPPEVAIGIAYKIPRLLFIIEPALFFDIGLTFWSNTMDTWKLEYRGGEFTNVPQSLNVDYPVNWNNTMQFSGGVEGSIGKKWRLRFGLGFRQSPVSDSDLNPAFPMVNTMFTGLGFSYAWSKTFNINLGYQHAWEFDSSITNSPFSTNLNDGKLVGKYDVFLVSGVYEF